MLAGLADKPRGYTHVLDTSILANRVQQLEAVLSRLLTRLDNVDAYQDLLKDWQDPLPTYKPNENPAAVRSSMRERSNTLTSMKCPGGTSEDGMELDHPQTVSDASVLAGGGSVAGSAPTPSTALPPTVPALPVSSSLKGITPLSLSSTIYPAASSTTPGGGMGLPYIPDNEPWMAFERPAHNLLASVGGMGSSSTEPPSKAPSIHEHDAALALEGMALGRDIQESMSAARNQIEPKKDNDEPTPGSPLTFSSFIQQKRSMKNAGTLKPFPSVALLPSIIVGKYVITHFLEHVDFRWRCLHRPTFEAQYSQLSSRLRSKSIDFYREELSTLALYASCLAVGIHFLDEEGYRDLSMTEEQAEDLAATCWKVSYEALEASDWMQVHDIRSCQTIIIAGIFLSSVRRANQHWTLLGSATKVAMALGLANVPDETKIISGQIKRIPPRWRSTIDREVARRVWYCLLELDWLFSMEYGFLYLISPEIHQTTEPANINDVDIKEDEPVVSLPRETYTDMSYFLQRLKLFYPFQKIVSKARKVGRMRYSFVIEANEELQAAIALSPAYFRRTDNFDTVDANQLYRLKREGLALSEGADLRLMRLHRYYFSEACVNSRYLLSKQVCLSSACHLLDIKDRPEGSHYTNAHYWAHTYCIFAATVVTIIYLNYALPQELEDLKAYTLSGIQQLRSLSGRRRTDLGETADTLQTLMNVQLSRRTENPEPDLKRPIGDLENDAWEGWLPPDLVALARLNPGLQMQQTGDEGSQLPSTLSVDGQDGFFFDSLLDDLQFNESGFIM
jgi:hypothetical protein